MILPSLHIIMIFCYKTSLSLLYFCNVVISVRKSLFIFWICYKTSFWRREREGMIMRKGKQQNKGWKFSQNSLWYLVVWGWLWSRTQHTGTSDVMPKVTLSCSITDWKYICFISVLYFSGINDSVSSLSSFWRVCFSSWISDVIVSLVIFISTLYF